jgi:hypothetical protein
MEFSRQVLSYIPRDMNEDMLPAKIDELWHFLADVSVYTPLSSDPVECVHGFLQAKLHRFRGRKNADAGAQELGLWSVIKSSYRIFWEALWAQLGDKAARVRCARFGRKTSNQYVPLEKRLPHNQKQGPEGAQWMMPNMDKLCKLENIARKPRKLSGFLTNTWYVLYK